MGKGNRNRRNYPKGPMHVHRADSTAPDLTPSAAYGSFQGSMWLPDRGYVYIPTLDTAREVDTWSRLELLKRARFVYNSGGGLPHRAVHGIARMVCGKGLIPHPLTSKSEINDLIRRTFIDECGSKNTFDLARKYNFFSAQRLVVRQKKKDGDLAPVIARSDGGLRCAFYESHQIGDGMLNTIAPLYSTAQPAQTIPGIGPCQWRDGVLVDRHNAPVAYRIRNWDWMKGEPPYTDVPAANVLFCANAERIGQTRGLTSFYPVINKVIDREEIKAVITKGIKRTSEIAYYLEQQMRETEIVPGAAGSMMPRAQKQVQLPGGRVVDFGEFLRGGEMWDMPPGKSFKVIQPNNPHPNVQAHLWELMRDIAWALGISPELLWNIIELGGANTRFVMLDTQSFIEEEQDDLCRDFCAPWYLAWLADAIAKGKIPYPGDDWYHHAWLPPARLTVDFGRDGKLYIEQYKRGLITLSDLYGYQGEEWKIKMDQYLDERRYIKEGLEKRQLTWEEAFPELRQTAIAAGAEQDNPWEQPDGADKNNPDVDEDEDSDETAKSGKDKPNDKKKQK